MDRTDAPALMKLMEDIRRLGPEMTIIADQVQLIKDSMTGKGISPAEAPLVQARLQEIENKLRMVGNKKNNLIPWLP
jgi:hypothetical protein